jgi:hypothetical protein
MTNPQQPGGWSQPPSWSNPTDTPPPIPEQQSAPVPGSPAAPTSPYAPDPASPPYLPEAGGYGTPPADYPAATAYPAPAGYPVQPYPGQPMYGYPAVPPNNGMAIASLVVSIVGVLGLCGYGLGGYVGAVGAILGHVARRQIRERNENGDGMALAGIIVGWVATGLALLATLAIVAVVLFAVSTDPTVFETDY